MAFRKTAISLIVIAFVTAGVAGVYLWYNFTARSNLILVVPSDCHWFYHFQTKQIRSKTEKTKPRYLDSIASVIAGLKAFENVKDPGDVGIALFSDIVIFENNHGRYLALSMNSEPRVKRFFNELLPKGMASGMVTAGNCSFAKAADKNLYFAFKHKAFIVFQPTDTTDNLQLLEKALAEVFAEQSRSLVTAIPAVKDLYNQECDVVFYTAKPNKVPTHGVVLDADYASLNAPNGGKIKWSEIEVMYSLPGMALSEGEVGRYGSKRNRIKSQSYLELSMKSIFEYLKNYQE